MKRRIKKFLLGCGINVSDWRGAGFDRRVARAAQKTYSQYGEDAVLRGLMMLRGWQDGYKGFWVDIGCHHPTRYSNTRMFSELGWTGINVDAMADVIEVFRKRRPQDINVNVGIGPEKGVMDYFVFAEHALNTFSRASLDTLALERGHPLRIGEDYTVTKVPVITLAELLNTYLPAGQHIDYLTIDAEGLDLSILQSNDWVKYRPDYVLAEIHSERNPSAVLTCDMTRFLSARGYEFAAQCACTTVYRRRAC